MTKLNNRKGWKRLLACFLTFTLAASSVILAFPAGTASAAETETPYIVSANRAVYASSIENGQSVAENAVDNNTSTKWGSDWSETTSWLYVDLGKETDITSVTILWENAYAKKYRIQFSNDETNWADQRQITDSDGNTDEISLSGKARYVRIYCEEKAMQQYGYSFYEFQVYGLNGLTKPAKNYGANIALNKPTIASSESDIWWLIAYYPPGAAKAENAVDGKKDTLWRSSEAETDQWIYVDLENKTEIGTVMLDWNNEGAGRYYDIQVSDDAANWTTIYRETKGTGGKKIIPLYANARYIRMYGYGKHATSNGFWLNEFEVYPYIAGDEKPTYKIPALPKLQTVTAGKKGSYLTNDVTMPQARVPLYKDESLQAPLASNDWWQSLLISNFGNTLCTLPLKAKYTKQGFGILTATDGWLNDRSVVSEASVDFYLMPGNLDSASLYNKVSGYGDYSVKASLYDDTNLGMESTIIKGSPYVFHEFKNTKDASIYSNTITKIFNDSNQAILTENGASITTDHIGLEITDSDNKAKTATSKSYYCVTVPQGTTFQLRGSKINIKFPNDNGFMSVGSMTLPNQLNYFYQHGYAFVKNTHVNYTFDEATSKVVTTYTADTELKRTGFSNQTMQNLLPHQWKKSDTALTSIVYPSVRGDLKLKEGNSFVTTDTFQGMVPQFTLPTNDEYSKEAMIQYLDQLDSATKGNIKSADAYWQGKTLHPLAMGVLAADQMGEGEYMGTFISRLKIILEDWLTYSGPEDECYLYYDSDWGTMYYKVSEFGANTGITDHHFTYGYLVFAATVLATYDEEFYNNYKDMIDHMVRDYANPSDQDPLYPRFRNYDMYEGHSWAGGYADNDDGNNQEAAGESLFGWVGEYLWGVRTGNKTYRNAGIFGFTTELNAVEQYWFNFDGDNWINDWTHTSVGQVYGGTNFFGTFFNGDPVYIYGIHWLPTAEYLTSYGFNKSAAANLYQGLLNDVDKERILHPDNKVDGPDEAWQHICWPIQALSDPTAVLSKWDSTKTQANETFNTYWFINNMADLGGRVKDVWAVNGASATVYKKGNVYQALAWNPTTAPVTIQFRNAAGIIGSVTVKAKSLVRVDPTVHTKGTVGNPTTPIIEENYIPETDGINVAAGKPAFSSSNENPSTSADKVTDGNGTTRWSSQHTSDEWIYIDLGEEYPVTAVTFQWENSYAKKYEILTSLDGETWQKVATKKNGAGGKETVGFVPLMARYVKMQGIERAMPYGYSIWEMEVYCGKLKHVYNVVGDDPGIFGAAWSPTLNEMTLQPDGTHKIIFKNVPANKPIKLKILEDGTTLGENANKTIGIEGLPTDSDGNSILKPAKNSDLVITYKPDDTSASYELIELKDDSIKVAKATLSNVTKKSPTQLTLKWNKVSKSDGYEIFRSTAQNGTYKQIKTITSGNTLSYTDAKLVTGTSYYYKLRAYQIVNGKKIYGDYSPTKTQTTALKKVSLKKISIKSTSDRAAALRWTKVTRAQGYIIYQSTKSKGKYKKIKTLKGNKTVKFTAKKLKKGQKYYYKVRAYRVVAGKKVYGAYSKIQSAKVN